MSDNEQRPIKLGRVRVVADGGIMGTRIYDEYGNDITKQLKVASVTIVHKAGDIPRVTLDCHGFGFDIAVNETLVNYIDLSPNPEIDNG